MIGTTLTSRVFDNNNDNDDNKVFLKLSVMLRTCVLFLHCMNPDKNYIIINNNNY